MGIYLDRRCDRWTAKKCIEQRQFFIGSFATKKEALEAVKKFEKNNTGAINDAQKNHRQKISASKTGRRNPQWKGDDVGYTAIHSWVKRQLPKPEECQACQQEKARDLANISQKYKRDLTDWEWLCRRCHMKKDGRFKNLNRAGRKKGFKHNEETKIKISEAQKATHQKPGYRERMIEAHKVYWSKPGSREKASLAAQKLNYVGKRNPNWKGGISLRKVRRQKDR